MFEDVEEKRKKKNKLYFSRDSESLRGLNQLMEKQNHETMILWALDCGRVSLELFEKQYPEEKRPRVCLDLCEAWAKGLMKMPLARKAILASHAAAREINNPEYELLCRAIAHAGATVHTPRHAIGLPIYELTYLVKKKGNTDYKQSILEKINYYEERLQYWQVFTEQNDIEWASFIRK